MSAPNDNNALRREPGLEISIDAMLPKITEQIAEQLRERALRSIEHTAAAVISEEVAKYIRERIVPEVQTELEAHHAELRAAFVVAIKQSIDLAAEKCVETTTKRLASYEGDKLVADVLRVIVGSRY